MNMDNEYSFQSQSHTRSTSQPDRRSGKSKGRYLKEQPKTARRRRRKLNPRFVIFVAGLLALSITMILVLRSCTKPSIVGRWNLDGTTVYEFEEQGRGALVLMSGEYEFQYEIEDDILKIDFIDEIALDATYSFELQKDVLFLTGGPGDAKSQYALQRMN